MNRLFLLLFGMVTLVAHAQGQISNDAFEWTLVFEDDVFNVAFGESQHFLSTRTSVYKSDDTETWTECNWPLGIVRNGTSTAPGLHWNDERVIVGALDNGFFISTDAGETFTQTGPTGYGCQSASITQLPNGEAIGMMGGYQRGLWKCGTIPETTWSNQYSVGADQRDIQYHEGDLYAVSYASNHQGGLLKSIDSGESWEIMYATSYSENPLSFVILNDTLIYLNQQGETHHVNLNTWTEISMYDVTINSAYDLHYFNGSLFASNSDGIFVSHDLGITWQGIGPNTLPFIHLVEYDGILFAAGESGLWSAPLTSLLSGCTDPTACNFDSEATSDDGSCIPSGCMEAEACNYNALAECEGEACDYNCCPGPGCCGEGMYWDYETQTCVPEPVNPTASEISCGPGTYWDDLESLCLPIETCNDDLDGDGVIGINDLMQLLSSFGTMCEDLEPETGELTCGDPVSYHGYDYATVQIGEQCWFAENLRTELYQNGDSIPGDLSTSEWSNADDTNLGAQAVYGEGSIYCENEPCDEEVNLVDFGRLYNWFAVDDARGLCPNGWHVPSDGEYTELTDHFGGEAVAGDQMKTDYGWFYDGNGPNSSGFSALPGGWRTYNGSFGDVGYSTSFWSSTPNLNQAWNRELSSYDANIYRSSVSARNGYSVRCLKD